jgi:hypothetical protein
MLGTSSTAICIRSVTNSTSSIREMREADAIKKRARDAKNRTGGGTSGGSSRRPPVRSQSSRSTNPRPHATPQSSQRRGGSQRVAPAPAPRAPQRSQSQRNPPRSTPRPNVPQRRATGPVPKRPQAAAAAPRPAPALKHRRTR